MANARLRAVKSGADRIDALTTGVGSLVDADMDATSTRLAALQTQQQLGLQSLSLANANARLMLKLFEDG